MPVYLQNLRWIPRPGSAGAGSLQDFLEHPAIAPLGWPGEVVRQWLWEHGVRESFLRDYAGVDLSRICWSLESVPAANFDTMPTGPSDGDCMGEYARHHEHYLARRKNRPEIANAWENKGTWIVPPILISRRLLQPPGDGLQLVEGRTRVGLLRGRRRSGLPASEHHHAWVGRPLS